MGVVLDTTVLIAAERGISCHTFRATGITNYLQNGGSLDRAQQMAAHASPQTTRLYDRTSEQVDLAEFERIHI